MAGGNSIYPKATKTIGHLNSFNWHLSSNSGEKGLLGRLETLLQGWLQGKGRKKGLIPKKEGGLIGLLGTKIKEGVH